MRCAQGRRVTSMLEAWGRWVAEVGSWEGTSVRNFNWLEILELVKSEKKRKKMERNSQESENRHKGSSLTTSWRIVVIWREWSHFVA